jgi:hypothetical protein
MKAGQLWSSRSFEAYKLNLDNKCGGEHLPKKCPAFRLLIPPHCKPSTYGENSNPDLYRQPRPFLICTYIPFLISLFSGNVLPSPAFTVTIMVSATERLSSVIGHLNPAATGRAKLLQKNPDDIVRNHLYLKIISDRS